MDRTWHSKLYECTVSCSKKLTKEEIESGPKHATVHTVTYYVDGIEYGTANAASLHKASTAAAEKAYHTLAAEIKGE